MTLGSCWLVRTGSVAAPWRFVRHGNGWVTDTPEREEDTKDIPFTFWSKRVGRQRANVHTSYRDLLLGAAHKHRCFPLVSEAAHKHCLHTVFPAACTDYMRSHLSGSRDQLPCQFTQAAINLGLAVAKSLGSGPIH